jgi:hypothetical protein
MKRAIHYIGLVGLGCGLTTECKRDALRRIGIDNVATFRPATQADVDWVKGMGGYVPDGRIAKEQP